MSRIDAVVLRVQRWDARACIAMNRALRYAALVPLLRGVSWLGNGIFWYSLMLAFLLHDGVAGVQPVVHMILVGAACTTIYKLLKRGTLRPRPYEALPVAPGAMVLDDFSFPSGHTLHAVAFTLVATAYHPGLALPLALFTALTAISRVVLGLHYPSDVLAGAAIGAAIAGISLGI